MALMHYWFVVCSSLPSLFWNIASLGFDFKSISSQYGSDLPFFWAYLLIILGIGVRASKYVKNLQDYSIGGRGTRSFLFSRPYQPLLLGAGFQSD